MSSRSNGVMNEEFTLRRISCVDSSAACSISFISLASASRPAMSAPSTRVSTAEPVTRWADCWENRS